MTVIIWFYTLTAKTVRVSKAISNMLLIMKRFSDFTLKTTGHRKLVLVSHHGNLSDQGFSDVLTLWPTEIYCCTLMVFDTGPADFCNFSA